MAVGWGILSPLVQIMTLIGRLLAMAVMAGTSLIASAYVTAPRVGQAKNEIYQGQLLVKHNLTTARMVEQSLRSRFRAPVDLQLRAARPLSRIGSSGWILYEIPKTIDPRLMASSIQRSSTIITAQPVNRIYPLLEEPNDPDWNYIETSEDLIFNSNEEDVITFRRLWHLDDVAAFAGWSVWPNTWYTAKTKPTNAPLLAIIDTGCDMNHPDFANAGRSSTNSVHGGQLVHSLSKQFRFGEIQTSGSPTDSHGHGTHVAGLAVAAGNNGGFEGNGVVGTGYGARAMILRVFDNSGNGSDADAAAALYYAADQGAAVINLSLGTTNYSQLFQDAVTYAFQKGTLVVCAGNESGTGGGDLGPIYPAACSGAFAVTANGPDLVHATQNYAGTGYYMSMAAPGGDVVIGAGFSWFKIQYDFSTGPRYEATMNQIGYTPEFGFNYAYLVGTSMASPVVAGAVSHWFGMKGLTQASPYAGLQAFQTLQRTAWSYYGAPNGSWEPTHGYGCLDMESLMLERDTRGSVVGSMQGSVYYNATALANVAVRANRVGSSVNYQTTTQVNGTYRFDQLPPGVYMVRAAPFGSLKTRYTEVRAGCDMPGFDFWCGGFTWDETPPVVSARIVHRKTNSLLLAHHMYDPETSVQEATFQIGTSVGASNTLAPTRVIINGSPTVTISGFNLVRGTTYWGRLSVKNGGDLVTNQDFNLTIR
jgi:hypothetical protein